MNAVFFCRNYVPFMRSVSTYEHMTSPEDGWEKEVAVDSGALVDEETTETGRVGPVRSFDPLE